jgi:hypothetical protein
MLYLRNSSDNTREPYLLALIKPCETAGLDAALPENPLVRYTRTLGPHMVHMQTINSVIGRIQLDNGWAIIDWSRSGACTQFIDNVGNDFD